VCDGLVTLSLSGYPHPSVVPGVLPKMRRDARNAARVVEGDEALVIMHHDTARFEYGARVRWLQQVGELPFPNKL
jgi:hypothetical protein